MFSETLEELLGELEGYNHEIFWSHGKSLPDCFNEPTERALADPDVYALLFCEDDMIIPKGILGRMFNKAYPLVALDYPFREQGDSTLLHDPHGYAYWSGTGFLLVAKGVLANMEKPIWKTQRTWEMFVGPTRIYFWPRTLKKVAYGLHDLNFGMTVYSADLPIMPMQQTAGQRKLKKLGRAGTNNGQHDIEELTEVGRDLVSGIISKDSSEKLRGALNRVKSVEILDDIPEWISYDENQQPYLNDGREFERI